MNPACEIVPAIELVERNNFVLPADWIVVNEVHSTREYYRNIRTGLVYHSIDDVFRYENYQRINNILGRPYGHCVGCRCFEHTARQCTSREAYAIAFNESFTPPPFKRGQSGRRIKYRCSRCGHYGHNKRTCHGPPP